MYCDLRIASEIEAAHLAGKLEEIENRSPWYRRIFGR